MSNTSEGLLKDVEIINMKETLPKKSLKKLLKKYLKIELVEEYLIG